MAIQENPYLPPSARVEDAEIARGNFIEGGRSVPAGHGWDWIASGWAIFKRQPGAWVLIAIVFGVIAIMISFVPFLGWLATPIAITLFEGGFMLACTRLEGGEDIGVADLFSGFQKRGGPLALLGLIGFGLSLLAMIPAAGLFAYAIGFGGRASGFSTGIGMALVVLVYLALLVPALMAVWFGPALVSLQDVTPGRAIAQSFRACLKNIVPFLFYGLLFLPLVIVATLPLMLGWLVLGPVMMTSTYAAYRDIYFED